MTYGELQSESSSKSLQQGDGGGLKMEVGIRVDILLRRPQSCTARQALDWNQQKPRKRVRLQSTWRETTKKDLRGED